MKYTNAIKLKKQDTVIVKETNRSGIVINTLIDNDKKIVYLEVVSGIFKHKLTHLHIK